MKKLVIFMVFILSVAGFYYFQFVEESADVEAFYYYDDFDSLNKEFWYVGEWLTLFDASEKVSIKNGILTIPVNETDRSPFLLSEPIPIQDGDIITIKRRAKMHYGNENFTGGMSVVETDSPAFKPELNSEDWGTSFGNGVVLVEYVHNYDENSQRPGRDIFRVLPPTWKQDHNYAVVDPVFDDWFEEELEIDMRSNKITYSVNGNEVKVNGSPITKDYIRVFMHSYGQYTGHYTKVDWIEISIEHGR